jgi:hypothetical protein
MNRQDIEHMWKVASNDPSHDTNWHDPVVIRFATLVASAEREAILAVIGDNQCECRCSEVVRDRGQA